MHAPAAPDRRAGGVPAVRRGDGVERAGHPGQPQGRRRRPRPGHGRRVAVRAPVRPPARRPRHRHQRQRREARPRPRRSGRATAINYKTTPDWDEAVLDLTGGVGVDHVVEVGGAGTLEKSLRAVPPDGHRQPDRRADRRDRGPQHRPGPDEARAPAGHLCRQPGDVRGHEPGDRGQPARAGGRPGVRVRPAAPRRCGTWSRARTSGRSSCASRSTPVARASCPCAAYPRRRAVRRPRKQPGRSGTPHGRIAKKSSGWHCLPRPEYRPSRAAYRTHGQDAHATGAEPRGVPRSTGRMPVLRRPSRAAYGTHGQVAHADEGPCYDRTNARPIRHRHRPRHDQQRRSRTRRSATDNPTVELLPIPQLVAAGTVEAQTCCRRSSTWRPSRRRARRRYDLPWEKKRDFAVGELAPQAVGRRADAHRRGGQELARAQPGRSAPADPAVERAGGRRRRSRRSRRRGGISNISSPRGTRRFPTRRSREQQVVLTVPASFDAAARELTREAALAAGLPDDVDPARRAAGRASTPGWPTWATAGGSMLKVGDTLLVCDVGGGTTDFTLVGVAEEDGELVAAPRRGRQPHAGRRRQHGPRARPPRGDARSPRKGVKLDPWQSVSLWHSCRAAKEALLAEKGPKKHPVSVLGRGSKLIGGTVSVDVDREAVDASCSSTASSRTCDARRAARAARASGLPRDRPAVRSRHRRHAAPGRRSSRQRSGDGRQAASARRTCCSTAACSRPTRSASGCSKCSAAGSAKARPPQSLEGNHDLDHAVARGAAYYGWAKRGGGVRIRGGTARSYYVGIETAGLAIPGAPRPLRALCVVPFGMEEGTEADVPGGEIGLVVGEPAHVPLLQLAPCASRTSPATLLDALDGRRTRRNRFARSEAAQPDEASTTTTSRCGSSRKITELGVFELWCVSTRDRRSAGSSNSACARTAEKDGA